MLLHIILIEGSLKIKLPTISTDGTQGWEEPEKRREEERRSETRNNQKKEDAGARKGRKVAFRSVFPTTCGSRGSKSRLAKAGGTETSGDEKLNAVVARSTFTSEKAKTKKTPHSQNTFGRWHVEKVHTVVARRKFRSQKSVTKLLVSDHFWTFRCRLTWQARGILDVVTGEQNVKVL